MIFPCLSCDEILFDDTDDVEEEDEIMQVSETQTSLKPAVDPPQTTVTTTQKPVIDTTKPTTTIVNEIEDVTSEATDQIIQADDEEGQIPTLEVIDETDIISEETEAIVSENPVIVSEAPEDDIVIDEESDEDGQEVEVAPSVSWISAKTAIL